MDRSSIDCFDSACIFQLFFSSKKEKEKKGKRCNNPIVHLNFV